MTEQERNFYIHKNTGKMPSKPRKPSKHGNLYLNGELLLEGQPYALLQYKKKELIKQGYLPAKIEIHRYER